MTSKPVPPPRHHKSQPNLAVAPKEHGYFKTFLSKAFGGDQSSEKKMEISGPINFTHEVHVGFDAKSGEFTVKRDKILFFDSKGIAHGVEGIIGSEWNHNDGKDPPTRCNLERTAYLLKGCD